MLSWSAFKLRKVYYCVLLSAAQLGNLRRNVELYSSSFLKMSEATICIGVESGGRGVAADAVLLRQSARVEWSDLVGQ